VSDRWCVILVGVQRFKCECVERHIGSAQIWSRSSCAGHASNSSSARPEKLFSSGESDDCKKVAGVEVVSGMVDSSLSALLVGRCCCKVN
jgi:hypothetical protein